MLDWKYRAQTIKKPLQYTANCSNREFSRTTDQSCLNRFLTEADWDVEALNERRLDFLQQDVEASYCERGVIAIDNVLIDHSGQCIEDVGWFWDHAEAPVRVLFWSSNRQDALRCRA